MTKNWKFLEKLQKQVKGNKSLTLKLCQKEKKNWKN